MIWIENSKFLPLPGRHSMVILWGLHKTKFGMNMITIQAYLNNMYIWNGERIVSSNNQPTMVHCTYSFVFWSCCCRHHFISCTRFILNTNVCNLSKLHTIQCYVHDGIDHCIYGPLGCRQCRNEPCVDWSTTCQI